jgi:adenylylsulfate kinase-like enzyme
MANVTISVNGPSKSGQTSLANHLVQFLQDQGFEIILLPGEDNIIVVEPLALLAPQLGQPAFPD